MGSYIVFSKGHVKNSKIIRNVAGCIIQMYDAGAVWKCGEHTESNSLSRMFKNIDALKLLCTLKMQNKFIPRKYHPHHKFLPPAYILLIVQSDNNITLR